MRSAPTALLRPFIFALAIAPLLAAPARAGSARPDAADAAASAMPQAEIHIGMQIIRADVADTAARKRQGLSGRTSLAEGTGMYFPYEIAGNLSFWMQDMNFPLDFVWVREGAVVGLRPDVPHEPGRAIIVRPPVPADAALEVPAGTIARWGWQIGDPVRVVPIGGD